MSNEEGRRETFTACGEGRYRPRLLLSCRGVRSIPWATTCNEPHAETVPAGLLHTGSANHLQREHTKVGGFTLAGFVLFLRFFAGSSLLSGRT
jgi:hypothetical protein